MINFPWPTLLDIALKSSFLVLLAGLVVALWRPAAAVVRNIWVGTSYALVSITALGVAALLKWQAPVRVAVSLPPETTSLPPSTVPPSGIDYPLFLSFLWILGAVLMLCAVATAHIRLRSIVKRCSLANASPEVLGSLSRSVGVKRPWILLTGPSTPFTCGILKPTIVLPDDWRSWPERQQQAVLLHELSHIRGADVAAQNAALLICCVQWFNPLAWLALSRLRNACEAAADETVLQSGVRASEYAEALLALAAPKPPRFRTAALPFSNRPLHRRIQSILNHASRGKRAAKGQCLLVTLPLFVLTVLLGGLRIEAEMMQASAKVANALLTGPNRPVILSEPTAPHTPLPKPKSSAPRPASRKSREWHAGYQSGATQAVQVAAPADEFDVVHPPVAQPQNPEVIPPVDEAQQVPPKAKTAIPGSPAAVQEPPNPAFTAKQKREAELATQEKKGTASTTIVSGNGSIADVASPPK